MRAFNGEIVVNLDALRANWRLLGKKFSGGQVGAVVKANAYGLGVQEVVGALSREGCQSFFVSNLPEAKSVRATAPNAIIYVFAGCAEGEERAFERYNIRPVLISFSMAQRWASFSFSSRPASAIKIDSGMGRYGLSPAEFERFLSECSLSSLSVDLLISHFASAEEAHNPANQSQVAVFKDAFARFIKANPLGLASFCNSSAIFNLPVAHFDLARPGYALYGGNPTPSLQNPMQEVVTVKLPVVQVKGLAKGEAVGYGGEFVAPNDMTVATVYGGYADGVFRSGVGQLSLIYKHKHLPVIGRVSMDSLVVDLSLLCPNQRPQQGDWLTFVGGLNTLERVASMSNTIGYELLTSLSRRFDRCYKGGE